MSGGKKKEGKKEGKNLSDCHCNTNKGLVTAMKFSFKTTKKLSKLAADGQAVSEEPARLLSGDTQVCSLLNRHKRNFTAQRLSPNKEKSSRNAFHA